jgi:hypothetical protein
MAEIGPWKHVRDYADTCGGSALISGPKNDLEDDTESRETDVLPRRSIRIKSVSKLEARLQDQRRTGLDSTNQNRQLPIDAKTPDPRLKRKRRSRQGGRRYEVMVRRSSDRSLPMDGSLSDT